jgi:hypothetical protein
MKDNSPRVMAFHEKAGPCQVDFDLPFLKSPFPALAATVPFTMIPSDIPICLQ